MTTQTTPQKSLITQRLRTDLGRSVGVTTATQLVWLTGLRAHLPTNCNSRLIKRTHFNTKKLNANDNEGADRVRGRGEKRGREGEKRGREEGEEGAGGGRRGGGRREKRGREEGEGRKKGREGERGNFCAREARAAPEGRRETKGWEGGGKGAGGGRGLPPCPPPRQWMPFFIFVFLRQNIR